MYKAIVVDDEKWIVEGIKVGVDWERFGFEVVGSAENGQEALRLIQELHPDVVLTDIKMPLMNGLELIKMGREMSPDTLFVVLSAHAEFAYAQKALNYGTFGYCLKPFEIEEIHTTLKKLSATLADRQRSTIHPSSSPELYESICANETEMVRKILRTHGMEPNGQVNLQPIVIQSSKLPVISGEIQHLSFQMSSRRLGCLVYEDASKAFIADILSRYDASVYSIGIGYPLSDLTELSSSLEAASLASYGIFTTGKSGVFHAPPHLNPLIEEMLRNLSESLVKKDRIQFITCMNTARSQFHNGQFSIKDAYLIFTALMTLFYREGATSSAKVFEGYEQLSYHYGDADRMIDYLVEHTLEYLSEEPPSMVTEVSHKTIKKILEFIHDHFTTEISIQSLSEKFYLSPNYLCHLFKKEVGDNFIEYISRLRIQYACKLLTETDLPIKQIGEKCGIHDYFYFTRIFKRIQGQTPTQYREHTR